LWLQSAELARIGLPISDDARGPKYHLEGYVAIGMARDDGNQLVEVEWWLQNPEGKYQGTVMQRVELPDGELSGSWWNDATYAAVVRPKAYSGCYPINRCHPTAFGGRCGSVSSRP